VIAAGSFAHIFGAGAAHHRAGLAGADANATECGAHAAKLSLFCLPKGPEVNAKTGRGRTASMQANRAAPVREWCALPGGMAGLHADFGGTRMTWNDSDIVALA